MCKSSTRGLELQIQAQERAAAEARAEAAKAQEEQKRIQEQALALQQQQLEFQKQQSEYQKEYDAKLEAIANRPTPPPPAPTATVVTGGSEGMAASDNSQANLDSRKKGRAALRIDLNAPQTAGATGLNVPRG